MEGHRESSLLQSQHLIHSKAHKGFLVKFLWPEWPALVQFGGAFPQR